MVPITTIDCEGVVPRAHAAYCVEVAAETRSMIIKTTFWDLARQWTRLATDIEMAVALRAELEADPKFDGSGASHIRL